jgi:hypothetical protein
LSPPPFSSSFRQSLDSSPTLPYLARRGSLAAHPKLSYDAPLETKLEKDGRSRNLLLFLWMPAPREALDPWNLPFVVGPWGGDRRRNLARPFSVSSSFSVKADRTECLIAVSVKKGNQASSRAPVKMPRKPPLGSSSDCTIPPQLCEVIPSSPLLFSLSLFLHQSTRLQRATVDRTELKR